MRTGTVVSGGVSRRASRPRRFCLESGVRGNLIPDADLAALAIESGSEWRGLRRLRVGPYRVIYGFDGKELLVSVVRVGHRREVYRQLDESYPTKSSSAEIRRLTSSSGMSR